MRAPLARCAALGAALLIALGAGQPVSAATGPALIKDVNTHPADSSVEGIVDVDGVAFFFACDGSHTRALWRSDGSADGTTRVQDLEPCEFRGSGPEHVGSRLVFTAGEDPNYSGPEQLWASTGGAPVMLGMFENPDSFADLNGALTFAVAGRELWTSDGAPEGTSMIKKLPHGISGSAVKGDALFLLVNERDLWTSDGSKAGTKLVKSLGTDAGVSDLATVGDQLFFRVKLPGRGIELWKSDGTSTGTRRVKDILPGAADAVGAFVSTTGGTLYFSAKGAGGTELWKSDGTSAGTKRVADLLPGVGSSKPRDLFAAGDGVFFSADDGVHGRGLYRSDGSGPGTVRLKDGAPVRSRYPDPTDAAAVGDDFFFSAKGPDGTELWSSDGAPEGTTQVKDIDPSGSSKPQALAAVGGRLFFGATEPDHGRELWASDGTEDGTAMVADLDTATAGSSPRDLSRAGSRLLFGASTEFDCLADRLAGGGCEPDEANPGDGLWVSDAANGAVLLGEVIPFGTREPGLEESPGDFVTVGGNAYFAGDDGVHGKELWKSDGTLAGTRLVRDIVNGADGSSPEQITAVGDRLYFTVGDRLWTSDGTKAGTRLITAIASSQAVTALTDVGGTLVVSAMPACGDGPCGDEPGQRLWKSNGTNAGTRPFTPSGMTFPIGGLTAVGTALYFTAGDGELWRSDLTAAGTKLVKDLGYTGSGLVDLTAVGDRLFFRSSSQDETTLEDIPELWTSNGMKAGTKRLARFDELVPEPVGLTAIGSTLYFSAAGGGNGVEPWTSDGTAAGTHMLADINPAGDSTPRANRNSPLADFTAIGPTVFFSATDGTTGRELWQTDGTEAGTHMVADIDPVGSSDPQQLTKVGNRLFFIADDGVHGQEVWRYMP